MDFSDPYSLMYSLFPGMAPQRPRETFRPAPPGYKPPQEQFIPATEAQLSDPAARGQIAGGTFGQQSAPLAPMPSNAMPPDVVRSLAAPGGDAPTQQLGLAPLPPIESAATPSADQKFFPGTTVNRDDPYAFGKVGVDPRDAKAYIGWGGPMPTLGFAPPAGASDPLSVYQNAFNMAMRNNNLGQNGDPAEAARLATATAGQVLNATMDQEKYRQQFGPDNQKRTAIDEIAKAAAAQVYGRGGTGEEAAAEFNRVRDAQKSQAAGTSQAPSADIAALREAAKGAVQKPGGLAGAPPQFDINPASIKSLGERLTGMSPEAIDALAADINNNKMGDRQAIRNELARQLYYDASLVDPKKPSGGVPYVPTDAPSIQANPNMNWIGYLRRAVGNALNPIGLSRIGPGNNLNQLQFQDGTILDLGMNDAASYYDRLTGGDRQKMLPSIQARNRLVSQLFAPRAQPPR